jgi:hypothetical protein
VLKKEDVDVEMVLSKRAKLVISAQLGAIGANDLHDGRESPFMNPSANPNDYSKVRRIHLILA